MFRFLSLISLLVFIGSLITSAQQLTEKTLSGVVMTPQFEAIPNVKIEVTTSKGKIVTLTDKEGRFEVKVPIDEPLEVRFSGKNLETVVKNYGVSDKTEDLQIKIPYLIPPISESVVIEAKALTPDLEERNESVYKNTLFGRDDQIIFTLNAGINAGQHEGGGKSLEIRRYGFNLDHGGVNGGLKVLVDNIQQNQSTQGHGQGYLGSLKSLSPELVKDVSIINGPFSAAYGDFSGLGVVQIRLRESLPQIFTARLQIGRFNTRRAFLAFSPKIKNIDSFIAYEPSYTDGPFKNPLRYRRDNVTSNLTYNFDEKQAIGIKFNFGRNDFTSSGQIPLDLVYSGQLDRFGFLDPENGGKVRQGTISSYFRKEWNSGATVKGDVFLSRSLFDLWSNFTFFLNDPIYGDEIQQHDSRLQEGANLQYLQPYKIFGSQALLTTGINLHLSQINVGLYPSINRNPNRKFLPENLDNPNVVYTKSKANVNNYAGYLQNSFYFLDGHLRLEAGLRFDYFTFDVDGIEIAGVMNSRPATLQSCDNCLQINGTPLIGKESAGKLQPKFSLVWSPSERLPVSVYLNYGRGISSQDARGVVRNPSAPKLSATDFYQIGMSYNSSRFSMVLSSFLIDRSREQVYVPDDGSIEFAERSRSYGVESRNSLRINRYLSLNGGLTRVIKAFYPGQFTTDGRRLIVDSAPHTIANASLVLSDVFGFNSSLNWRHISSYRLDGEDETIKASGHDVVDLSLSKRLSRSLDLNLAIDNLLNKKYFETQNYFESRTSPLADPMMRIHATPGYPITVSIGVTFRFGVKE
mgnify:CR=1 FL=1